MNCLCMCAMVAQKLTLFCSEEWVCVAHDFNALCDVMNACVNACNAAFGAP
jgi:hypothetical protein